MLKEIVTQNRSYRRFYEDFKISEETIKDFIDIARITGSMANMQPLKYIISTEAEKNHLIFQNLAWAGYLKDWNGPEKGERPSGYIVILGDTNIKKSNFETDLGIASQTILLAAVEKGFGGCMIHAIKRDELRNDLQISPQYEILLVIALGKPKEEIQLYDINEHEDIKYWRDSKNVHHVPKRKLENIILS